MGLKTRIVKWLGIPSLRVRVNRLEELEMFSLADVCDRLSESMVVLTGTGQTLRDVEVIVGGDKTGVLVLGNYTTIQGGLFRPPATETVTRVIEDYGEYTSLFPRPSEQTASEVSK